MKNLHFNVNLSVDKTMVEIVPRIGVWWHRMAEYGCVHILIGWLIFQIDISNEYEKGETR